jgi:serine protease Do
VGGDKFSDIAVIKVSGTMPAVAVFGNSDLLVPGETAIAIGSPLGDFKNTVTTGVVSATGRTLDSGEGYLMEGLIQTDAAINHGNSGGPLVNLAGEVVAINTMILRTGSGGDVVEGLGFAIPSNTVQAVAKQLIQNGSLARPYVGISWQWVTPDLAQRYNLPVQWGVYISQIATNSPAEKAGLKEGDIITKIGDTALSDTLPYINALYAYSPGQTVTLTVVRGSVTQKIDVVLGTSN